MEPCSAVTLYESGFSSLELLILHMRERRSWWADPKVSDPPIAISGVLRLPLSTLGAPPGSFGFEKKVAGAMRLLSPAKSLWANGTTWPCPELRPRKRAVETGAMSSVLSAKAVHVPKIEKVRDNAVILGPWKSAWCFPGS